MFERVAFKRNHVIDLLQQKINDDGREFFKNVNFDVIESLESFTGMLNGRPVVCGGVVPFWNGRGYLWTVFDEGSKNCFVPVFRGIKSFLKDAGKAYGESRNCCAM